MKPLPKMKRKGDAPDKTVAVVPHPARRESHLQAGSEAMDTDRETVRGGRNRLLVGAVVAVLIAGGAYD